MMWRPSIRDCAAAAWASLRNLGADAKRHWRPLTLLLLIAALLGATGALMANRMGP
jgi:ABC-type uncharacterized transport system permease subunit